MRAPSTIGHDSAEHVFSILISGAYRKNSLAGMNLAACRPEMLSTLRRRTKRWLPIQLTLLAFPFKVPNPAKVGDRRLPDFAELAAIEHLRTLRDAISEVYPPGLNVHILHDGSLIADVFGTDLQEVTRYQDYFVALVTKARASTFIRCHDFEALQRHSQIDFCSSIERLRLEAKRWWQERRGTIEWQRSFRKTLGMINLREFPPSTVLTLMRHAPTGSLPSGFECVERRVHRAMVGYYVQDAVIHQFDPRPHCFPDAIHATTQNRPGRLSLWLVRRGRSLLPWHGVGCFDDCGRTRVVHAADLFDQPSYKPEFIAREETPFAYRRVTLSSPLRHECNPL